MAEIEIKGSANLGINLITCVCGHCGHNDTKDAIIELNFREGRLIYVCSKCKKDNSMAFGKEMPKPYPRIGIGR